MAIKLLLQGGLGNQLFQYAAARSQSLRLGVPLTVDLRFYSNADANSSKSVYLTDLPILADVIQYDQVCLGAHHPIRRLWRKTISERPDNIWREACLGFDESINEIEDGMVLSGNFNSPLYFEDYWDAFSSEIDIFQTNIDLMISEFRGVSLSDYAAVHVRLGDYSNNPDFELRDGGQYYKKALEYARSIGFSKFLIFSDEPRKALQMAGLENAIAFHGDEGHPPHLDMAIMSRCGAVVIANSTFSWWAGWHASQRGSEVIAPSEWIMGLSSQEMRILPEGWAEIS